MHEWLYCKSVTGETHLSLNTACLMAAIQFCASVWSAIESVISAPPTPPTLTTPRRPPISSSETNTTLSAPISTRSSSLSPPPSDLNTWRCATFCGRDEVECKERGDCDCEENEVVCVEGPESDIGEDVSTSTRVFHCLARA